MTPWHGERMALAGTGPVRCGAGIATSVAVALALTAFGCGDSTVTAILCGDLLAPNDFDSVRVSFFDDEFSEQSTGVVLFLNPETTDLRQLPVITELEGAAGSGWARASALSEGGPVLRFDRRIATFGEGPDVELFLSRACLGSIRCPAGQTCIDGDCVLAPTEDEEPRCFR